MSEYNNIPPFTNADREACMHLLQEAEAKLEPHLASLTMEERKRTLKMGDKSTAFVEKSIQYSKEFPEVLPPIFSTVQMEQNFVKVQEFDHLIRKAEMLVDGMKDARLVAANQAYAVSLKVYQALRVARDMDLPGITIALEELGKRFSIQGRPNTPNTNKEGDYKSKSEERQSDSTESEIQPNTGA